MSDIQLTEDQKAASVAFTDFLIDETQKYFVIKGDPGTGKSTLVKHLIATVHSRFRMFELLIGKKREQGPFNIQLTATTNQAVSVIEELTGQDARTVHSVLGLVPEDDYKTGETNFIKGPRHEIIYNTLLIIDEASYISSQLLEQIDSSTVDCKILLVGDPWQLAPVKQKVPIMDSIQCKKVHLTEVMRHGGNIAAAGAKFKLAAQTGIFQPITPDGVDVIHVDGPTFQEMIDAEFINSGYVAGKTRVLAWQNTRVHAYNEHIRSILGHSPQLDENDVLITNKPIMGKNGILFATDEPVSITAVYGTKDKNGISGRMVQLDHTQSFFLPDNQAEVKALKKIVTKEAKATKNWKLHFEIKNDWLDLRPIFASTVHKSQGNTFETVFIDLSDIGRCNIGSDVARLMNVAITRSSKKVILYGQLPLKYQGV